MSPRPHLLLRCIVTLLAAGGGLACDPGLLPSGPVFDPGGQPQAAERAAADGSERVRVAYPRGACPTRRIEVQLHHEGAWRPHPEHPVVRAGDLRWERSEDLLALRVRCVDPGGRERPSPWVTGVRVDAAVPPAARGRP